MKVNNEKHNEPLIHLTRRAYMSPWKALGIRGIAIVASLIVSGIVAFILIEKLSANPERIFDFYKCFIDGSFSSEGMAWKFFKNVAILLCIALALTPAFRMRFWNIGAEGQVLMGMLGAIAVAKAGASLPNWLVLILMFLAAVLFGIVWAGIPALFKAFFNTNETLFTLMMNYVATYFVSYMLLVWVPSGNAMGIVNQDTHIGWLPTVIHNYFLIIMAVLILTGILFVYLNYTKHGYEISVVGESNNTARYIGINVKKVILRTMILSGALCGVAGFLMASGLDHSITSTSVNGQGFTAIMVSWLANFNPLIMIATSGLIVFLDMGGSKISEVFDVRGAMPNIIIGIILFFIIGCEFFIRYKINFRKKETVATNSNPEPVPVPVTDNQEANTEESNDEDEMPEIESSDEETNEETDEETNKKEDN